MLLTRDLLDTTLAGMNIPFNQWFQAKLKELGMTQADVIRNSGEGVKSSQISRIYNGEGGYDAPTIRTIAKGMKLPQTEVFFAAGLLTEDPSKPSPADPLRADVWNMLERMTDDEVTAVKVIMEQVFASKRINVKTRGSQKNR